MGKRSWYQVLIETVGLEEARRIAREKANKRNAANRDHVREVQRAYYARDPERWKAWHRDKYRRLREGVLKRNKKRREDSPVEYVARMAVAVAIKKGVLVRPTECSLCHGGGRIQAHHADYMKPLDVAWLCSKCHHALHRKQENNG